MSVEPWQMKTSVFMVLRIRSVRAPIKPDPKLCFNRMLNFALVRCLPTCHRRCLTMKYSLPAILMFCSCTAFAALGGAPSAPMPKILSGSPAAAVAGAASSTELKTVLDSGTEVREWVSPAGIVFAVAWTGPYLPDLREHLGSHFEALTDAQKQRSGSRSRVSVQQADLVIFSGGRMGAFEGRAWIPSLLPAGFHPTDIK